MGQFRQRPVNAVKEPVASGAAAQQLVALPGRRGRGACIDAGGTGSRVAARLLHGSSAATGRAAPQVGSAPSHSCQAADPMPAAFKSAFKSAPSGKLKIGSCTERTSIDGLRRCPSRPPPSWLACCRSASICARDSTSCTSVPFSSSCVALSCAERLFIFCRRLALVARQDVSRACRGGFVGQERGCGGAAGGVGGPPGVGQKKGRVGKGGRRRRLAAKRMRVGEEGAGRGRGQK
mgnify:CR=1 FL=1